MEYRALFCVALVLITADFGQTRRVDVPKKKLETFDDNETFRLENPSNGESSSLFLSYDLSVTGANLLSKTNYGKNVTLLAPDGYELFVSFSKIKFRTSDTLILSEPGTVNQKTYKGEKKNLNMEDFYSPSGTIRVSFKTVNGDIFTNLGGFELTCTVQGNVNKPGTCESGDFKCDNGRCISSDLRCNKGGFTKYQHCGDGSDHSDDACNPINIFSKTIADITAPPDVIDLLDKAKTTVGTIVGIVFGVIIALIVLGGLIAFLIFRRASQRSRTQGHVR